MKLPYSNEGSEIGMITAHPSSHAAASLLHVVNHWDERVRAQGPSPKATAHSIAISREAESGGPEVAREVGKRLGWRVYDRELLEQIATDLGVRADLLER